MNRRKFLRSGFSIVALNVAAPHAMNEGFVFSKAFQNRRLNTFEQQESDRLTPLEASLYHFIRDQYKTTSLSENEQEAYTRSLTRYCVDKFTSKFFENVLASSASYTFHDLMHSLEGEMENDGDYMPFFKTALSSLADIHVNSPYFKKAYVAVKQPVKTDPEISQKLHEHKFPEDRKDALIAALTDYMGFGIIRRHSCASMVFSVARLMRRYLDLQDNPAPFY